MIANISPSISAYEDTLNTLKYATCIKMVQGKSQKPKQPKKVETVEKLKEEVAKLKKSIFQTRLGRNKTLGQPNEELSKPSEKIRKIEDKLKTHFDQETVIKRKIFELEQENQSLAIKLFSLRLSIAEGNNGDKCIDETVMSIYKLERDIKQNMDKVDENVKTLALLYERRNDIISEIQRQILSTTLDGKAFQSLLKNALYDSMQMDFQRSNHYVMFMLKQRENYISHLKKKLIKSQFCQMRRMTHREGFDRKESRMKRIEENNMNLMLGVEQEINSSKSLTKLPDIASSSYDETAGSFLFLNGETPKSKSLVLQSPLRLSASKKYLPIIRRSNKGNFSSNSNLCLSLYIHRWINS
eukprot:TRINITY_DN1502_c0_g1_i2.p1 TRINITY_DN1502_c0_g1~~TRINITY_DN1502_c0_g1_i2.p1  ORF type:complete len:356 (+),score=35.62 TRINITY_DN1502_c0_g1_i2:1064-2131(+)